MMQVRTIREEECEPFLEVMCGAFGLEPARARQVFHTEPFFDLARKWAVFDGSEIVSVLTTTPLRFGSVDAIGIAGVATRAGCQSKGHAQALLREALERSHERAAILFANREELYRSVGFERIDTVIRGTIKTSADERTGDELEAGEVHTLYERWQRAGDMRLLRDERRWRHWRWVFRPCEAVGDGYVCVEPKTCREAVGVEGLDRWPLPAGTEWIGLASLTDTIGVPLLERREELLVMGRGFAKSPQMFMTDQF